MSKLSQRLQMKPGTRWVLINAPTSYAAVLDAPDDAQISITLDTDFNGIQLFVQNSDMLKSALTEIAPALKTDTIFWIMYPKKNTLPTDLQMTRHWDAMDEIGWRPVQSAAVDDTWTALRFKPVELVKTSNTNNAALKINPFGEYINPEIKTVVLPAFLSEALSTAAIDVFDKLAYSHKKEYVLWILTAKQQQTRLSRIEKMQQMLLAGKKNPSDKTTSIY